MEHLKFTGLPGSKAAHMFLDFEAWPKGEVRVISDSLARSKGFADASALITRLTELHPGLFVTVTPKTTNPGRNRGEKE